jgi:hypothetical protein
VDPLSAQLIQQRDEIAEIPAEAVQFPDNEGVTRAQSFEAAGEGRALDGRAGEAFVRENCRASCPLQGGSLQRRVLIVGADTRIAVFHAIIMRQTYATRKPLILCTLNFVAGLTLCATSQGVTADALSRAAGVTGRIDHGW